MAERILVVDDEKSILDMTALVLKAKGYEVSTALDGNLALQVIKEKKPDLIITDVLMPHMDGLDFYKALRQNIMTATIPVLIVTGRGLMEDSFRALGIDGFIAKPFTPEQLCVQVKKLLGSGGPSQQDLEAIQGILKTKVLINGNRQDVLDKMKGVLRRLNYETEAAVTGSDILDYITRLVPTVVVLDVHCDGMSAEKVVQKLRENLQSSKAPIILYNFYDLEELEIPSSRQRILNTQDICDKCIQAGATKYIGRFSTKEFIRALAQVVQKK